MKKLATFALVILPWIAFAQKSIKADNHLLAIASLNGEQAEIVNDELGPMYNFYGSEIINVVFDMVDEYYQDNHRLIQGIDTRGIAYSFIDTNGNKCTAMLYPPGAVHERAKLVILVH